MAAYSVNTLTCAENMPTEDHPNTQENLRKFSQNKKSSKQLLYSEKFDGCLEEKLRVTGKNAQNSCLLTYRPQPSSVLSQVRDFLPKLALANEQLQNLSPEEADIENVEGHEGPLIEMSLALMPGIDSDAESDTESDRTDDLSSASEDADDTDLNTKPCKRQRACIEELPNRDIGKNTDDRESVPNVESEKSEVIL